MVSLEELHADDSGHDLGETGDLPLVVIPHSDVAVAVQIVEAPVGRSNGWVAAGVRYCLLMRSSVLRAESSKDF